MSRINLLLACVLPFALASCASSELPASLPEIRTATATLGRIMVGDAVTATVEWAQSVDLSFKSAGRIASISVDIWDHVRKGQVIAMLGNEEATASAAGLRGSLHAMDASLDAVNAAAASMGRIPEAVSQLYEARIAVAKNDEERARIAVEMAQSDSALARELERYGVVAASGTVASAQESLDQAKANLSLARTNLEAGVRMLSGSTVLDSESVNLARANLDRARNELANTEELVITEREAARKNGLSALTSAFAVARDARDFLDTELGATDANAIADPARYRLLGAKDSTSKEKAKEAFLAFDRSYRTMLAWYEASIDGKPDADAQTVRGGLQDGLVSLDDLRRALHAFSTAVEASIPGTALDQNAIDALKTETTSRLSALESVILSDTGGGMKWSLSALDAVDAKESLIVGGLRDAVAIAENALQSALAGQGVGTDDRTRSLASLQTNLALAESLVRIAENDRSIRGSDRLATLATLATNVQAKEDALRAARLSLESARQASEVIRSERDAKLAETRAGVANLEASAAAVSANRAQTATQYELAREGMDSGIILAPYDGIVTRRYAESGSVVSAGMPIVAFAGSSGRVARVGVDPARALPVVGSEVSVRLAGDTVSHTGIVTRAAEHIDERTKKIPTEIRLPDTLRIGETVSVILPAVFGEHAQEDVVQSVLVPFGAIVTRYGPPGVFVVDSQGFARLRRVKLLRSDSRNTAVEGLESGEIVVTEWQDLLLDGQKVR